MARRHWNESELDAVLTGSMAPFRGRLAIGPAGSAAPATAEPRVVSAQALMTREHLLQVRRHFDAAHGVTDASAVASIWTKWHFAIVMPAWFIGRVLMGRRLPTALDRVLFEVNDEGRTLCLRLPDAGEHEDDASGPDRSWREFMEQHLGPFVELMAERTGVTRRVLWSNAGNLYESFIQRLDQTHPGQRGMARARQLLQTRSGVDGRSNPMYQPVIYVPRAGGVQRMRRICCMRYLVPDRVFCSTCPSPLLNASNNACAPAPVEGAA